MRLILPTVCLLLASCAHYWSSELPATHPEAKRIYETLHDRVIPSIDLIDVPVSDAIFALSKSAQNSDPQHRGVSIVLVLTPSDSKTGESVFPPPEPKVTVRGASMRYLDVLDAICSQAGLVWQIEPKCIIVHTRSNAVEPTRALSGTSGSP